MIIRDHPHLSLLPPPAECPVFALIDVDGLWGLSREVTGSQEAQVDAIAEDYLVH